MTRTVNSYNKQPTAMIVTTDQQQKSEEQVHGLRRRMELAGVVKTVKQGVGNTGKN